MSILEEILEAKRLEVESLQEIEPLEVLKEGAKATARPSGFVLRVSSASQPAVIAEIKRSSPSRGIIRADLDPIETALAFARSGAAAISVLTDSEFFAGDKAYIAAIKAEFNTGGLSSPPILRKDFIICPYQVWESRALGADALLLIVAALSKTLLIELLAESLQAELDVLLEVHDTAELELAIDALHAVTDVKDSVLLGINNRNLDTFETSLAVTKDLSAELKRIRAERSDSPVINHLALVAESGIFKAEDLKLLTSYGADAFLIGESLVASGDPGENLARLIGDYRKRE